MWKRTAGKKCVGSCSAYRRKIRADLSVVATMARPPATDGPSLASPSDIAALVSARARRTQQRAQLAAGACEAESHWRRAFEKSSESIVKNGGPVES